MRLSTHLFFLTEEPVLMPRDNLSGYSLRMDLPNPHIRIFCGSSHTHVMSAVSDFLVPISYLKVTYRAESHKTRTYDAQHETSESMYTNYVTLQV